jgi:ElaB/YqjD/DUF883 family membrane-anchored ribosome-binding protein
MQTPNAAEEAKLIDAYKEQLVKLGGNAERVMRRHPWAALCIAVFAGAVIGLLAGRRS